MPAPVIWLVEVTKTAPAGNELKGYYGVYCRGGPNEAERLTLEDLQRPPLNVLKVPTMYEDGWRINRDVTRRYESERDEGLWYFTINAVDVAVT